MVLQQHYNIHTGERPYKCKYCERTFTNYPNWLKHTRRRHKVDHKTGAELEPKPTVAYLPKEETAPAVVVNATVPSSDPLFAKPQLDADSEQILADISMLKTEDLLQQGLLNFTPVDDKFLMQPQLDLNCKYIFLASVVESSGIFINLWWMLINVFPNLVQIWRNLI